LVRVGAIALALAIASCTPKPPMQTNLCDLVARAPELDGRLVRITAIHETDHTHSSFFSDPTCWDAGVVDFYYGPAFQDSARAREYDQASLRQRDSDFRLNTLDPPKDHRLDVTGVFRWVRDPEAEVDSREPRARIYVTELHSFEAVDHVYRDERARQFDRCIMSAIISGVEVEAAGERCTAETRAPL
jgi:hypothetical protein